jgi:hypothetical protein
MAKQPTEKQLAARAKFAQAAKDRASAARNAKLKEAVTQDAPVAPTVTEQTAPVLPANAVVLTQEQFQEMLERIQKLETVREQVSQNVQPSIGTRGEVLGMIERFPIDPKHYQSPLDAIYDDPQFRRFALRDNYFLKWSVTPAKYQTAMGTWYVEPRFELELWKRDFNEDNEEFRKILLGRASFFEDPPANLLEAELAGLSINDVDTGEFGEKMRMFRYKFWVNEILQPKRPGSTSPKKKLQVIGGKAYEIEEFSELA